MAQNVGWRGLWWLKTGLNCAGLLVVIVAFPETMWKREQTLEIATHKISDAHSSEQELTSAHNPEYQKKEPVHESVGTAGPEDVSENGRPSVRQFWPFQPNRSPFKQLVISGYVPFKLFLFPIIFWASCVQSWYSSVYLSITFVQATAFGAPPYNFNAHDWVSMRLTIGNGGIREAEMRLPTLLPYALIMILGNFVIAFGFGNHWGWRAIVIIGYGCAGVQATALLSIAATYTIDSCMQVATPIFVIITLNRDLWGYGISHWLAPWVEASGYLPGFMLNMCLLVLWLLVGGVFFLHGKFVRRLTKDSWVHTFHDASDANLKEILLH